MPGSFSTAPEQGGAPFENESCGNEGKGDFLDGLRGVGQFLSALQKQLRFGKASRLPLNLLRLELKGDALECDWIVRPPDTWDADLPSHVLERKVSFQALDDALAVRQLVFTLLPDVRRAVLRAYRVPLHPAGLIIEGKVSPGAEPVRVLSPAMRAKLNGFRFCIEDGILQPLMAD